MKKIILLLFIFANYSQAQEFSTKKLNRFVKEKNVKRIIQTLSSDAMKGRSAYKPEEMELATAFIETEFEKIGLRKFADLPTFRQNIMHKKIAPKAIEVKIDGKIIADSNFILISDNEQVTINGDEPIKIIEKEKNLFATFRNFANDSTTKIVLIAPEHANLFKRLKGYYGRPNVYSTTKKKGNGNSLFILANTDSRNITANAVRAEIDAGMNNVVGVLEGKSKKDEFVIFSGHYDHLGYLATANGDSIANGADDDASGTTAVIALAKYFKKLNNNERTLIFVAFTAEEIGGYGAKYFSENLNPDKVMAMINIEMIGKASKWGKNSAFMTGFDKSNLGEIMQKNLVGTEFQINPDPYPEQNLFYRSDNATLARQGVPAHSFSTDQIDSDALYHTVKDEFGSLDVSNIVATIKALAISSKSIVAGIDTPNRVDKSTVK
jgi:Peptidase family M28